MPYVTLQQLRAIVPEPWLTQSLDDNSDGEIDAWQEVEAAATLEVEGPLSLRYRTPFAPVPKMVAHAALIFAAEQCYLRRGVKGDENPFTKQADGLRSLLGRIAKGELALGVDLQREKPSASIITEPAKTYSRGGNLSV